MSIREIESKARELRQWLAIIEEAQTEVEALKDEIKAHLEAQGDGESMNAFISRAIDTQMEIDKKGCTE